MRSYGQFCALARSLDVIGDRWTLLIIRELFARESRYSDLRDGLPGIATNLLADRLRQLQADGLVESYAAPAPIRATVYRLTPRGRELGPVLRSLFQWGMPLLDVDQGDDEFRPQWLMLALRILLDSIEVEGVEPLTFMVADELEPITVAVTHNGVEVNLGVHSDTPQLMLEGDPQSIYAFLAGQTDPKSSISVDIEGTTDSIDRLNLLIERVRKAQGAKTRLSDPSVSV